ncbi:MAG TPA: 7-cyano-7-deazaguanine synthase [Phycisphaerae bacterium]|nr:7-cyano-7-deazaguanine synthase [Phycisphaerae bacterium]
MTFSDTESNGIPELGIDVVEPGRRARNGRAKLELNRDITFSTAGLESYAFARWEPLIYDAMVVAATVECGDRMLKRPQQGWPRKLSLRIPVHDPDRWQADSVVKPLRDALEFLTGDNWSICFSRRFSKAQSPSQEYLKLSTDTKAVIAYSDGMDSRAVACILGQSLGDGLVRVRVGPTKWDCSVHSSKRIPFATVPYETSSTVCKRESTARARGFKFALISGIAAYLTHANEVVIPESGQGTIGPALVSVGHGYPDYRNHPLFTVRMQRFIQALLGRQIKFLHPRIWHTKAETLRAAVSISNDRNIGDTRSCWRDNRWSSINGVRRQCGVCAACMLRRVAVHEAHLSEPADTYIACAMNAASLDKAVVSKFTKLTKAFREYAIAGFLHMDHLAEMADDWSLPSTNTHGTLLAPALGLSVEDACRRLRAMLSRHANEWKKYLESLGPNSFLMKWARGQS